MRGGTTMNRNYEAGVRFEREVMKGFNEDGFLAVRTAGSHGPFDVIVIARDGHVTFIQCKVVRSEAQAERLEEKWLKDPPIPPSSHCHQCLMVKVVRKGVRSVTV